MNVLPIGTPLGNLRMLEVYHFYDGPKLFACMNSTGQAYLVFWLGDDEVSDQWLFVPISDVRLRDVRAGRLSLRVAAERPEGGWVWRILTGIGREDTPLSTLVRATDLSEDDLPAEESFLELATATLPVLVDTAAIRASRTNREVLDYALKPEAANNDTLRLSTLGHSALAVQGLLEALVLSVAGYRSRRGRIPVNVQEEATLMAVGTFHSSFGLRLESAATADLFGETPVGAAIKLLFQLLEAGEDTSQLRGILSDLGGRVAARYAVFLSSLANSRTDLKLRWGSPSSAEMRASTELSWREAGRTSQYLVEAIAQFSETIDIPGRLDGVDVHRGTFSFMSYETNERYSGRVAPEFLNDAQRASMRVPAEYRATIRQVQHVNTSTEEVRERYLLLDLRDIALTP